MSNETNRKGAPETGKYEPFMTASRMVQAALSSMPYDELVEQVEIISQRWLGDSYPVDHFSDRVENDD